MKIIEKSERQTIEVFFPSDKRKLRRMHQWASSRGMHYQDLNTYWASTPEHPGRIQFVVVARYPAASV